METIKTFMSNAAKGPNEERESYTATSTDSTSASTGQTSKSASTSTAQTTAGSTGQGESHPDTTYDKDVSVQAPVVHERVHRKIVNEHQTTIDRDHHVDHYKQKIQPIAVVKTEGTSHIAGTKEEEERQVENDSSAALKKKLTQQSAGLKSSTEEDVAHETVNKEAKVNDRSHHHLHETVVPVVEKDVYKTDVVHNAKHVHEHAHDESQVEETEVLPTKKASETESRQLGVK